MYTYVYDVRALHVHAELCMAMQRPRAARAVQVSMFEFKYRNLYMHVLCMDPCMARTCMYKYKYYALELAKLYTCGYMAL